MLQIKHPWPNNEIPEAPITVPEAAGDSVKISWVPVGEKDMFRYVVYFKYGDNWDYEVVNRKDNSVILERFQKGEGGAGNPLTAIAVTAVGRKGNESAFKEIKIDGTSGM